MILFARLLLAAFISAMLAGLVGGLSRLISIPNVADALRAYHGPLLAAVVFPGLIGLERAVAIGRRWAWAPPTLAALAVIHLFASGRMMPPLLLAIGTFMLAQQLFLWRRSPGLDGEVGALAPAALLVADWKWSQGGTTWAVALGWATFLILVIAAERLELSFLARSGRLWPRVAILGMLLGAGLDWPRVIGGGWLVLALWLAAHDMARLGARRAGLTAYCARAVLLGYAWLAWSGLRLLVQGQGASFDGVLHGIFVGFVLSMVMAHGPIIFPALLRCKMSFSKWFYLPLIVLHLSLIWRGLGALSHGALGNLSAFLIFLIVLLSHLGRGESPWIVPNRNG